MCYVLEYAQSDTLTRTQLQPFYKLLFHWYSLLYLVYISYVLASTQMLRYDSDSTILLSFSSESVYDTKTHKDTAAAVTQLYTSER